MQYHSTFLPVILNRVTMGRNTLTQEPSQPPIQLVLGVSGLSCKLATYICLVLNEARGSFVFLYLTMGLDRLALTGNKMLPWLIHVIYQHCIDWRGYLVFSEVGEWLHIVQDKRPWAKCLWRIPDLTEESFSWQDVHSPSAQNILRQTEVLWDVTLWSLVVSSPLEG